MQIKIQDFEIDRVDYRKLKPVQGNLKSLSKKNHERLKKSFEEKGLFVPVFVWKDGEEYKLLDGHGRERFFQKEGARFVDKNGKVSYEVPCLIIEADNLKDAKEKLLIISSQYQSISKDGFKEFTLDLNQDWLKSTTHFDGLFESIDFLKKTGKTNPDEIPEKVDPKTKLGDFYKLGNHFLMCGDSTNQNHVSMLTNSIDKFIACITDPPYSVSYQNSNKARIRAGGGKKTNGKIYEEYKEGSDPKGVLNFIDHIKSDVLVFSYPIDRHFFDLADAFKKNGFIFHKELIWAKNKASFSPFSSTYQQQHEPILFCIRKELIAQEEESVFQSIDYLKQHESILIALKEGSKLGVKIPKNQTTILEYDKPNSHDLHPTAKPIELWSRLVGYHVPKGENFYEPFAGSGTAIIAGEMVGANCYAMELSPYFCDVIIKRWEDFTGKKSEKIK